MKVSVRRAVLFALSVIALATVVGNALAQDIIW